MMFIREVISKKNRPVFFFTKLVRVYSDIVHCYQRLGNNITKNKSPTLLTFLCLFLFVSPEATASYEAASETTARYGETHKFRENVEKLNKKYEQKHKKLQGEAVFNTEATDNTKITEKSPLNSEKGTQKIGDYEKVSQGGENIYVHESVRKNPSTSHKVKLYTFRITIPFVQLCATANTLGYMGQNGLTQEGILKFLGTQAAIGVMFSESYYDALKPDPTQNRCSSEGCTYLVIPAIMFGGVACLTDALNTGLGIYAALGTKDIPEVARQILACSIGVVNILAESFLYARGFSQLITLYSNLVRDARSKKEYPSIRIIEQAVSQLPYRDSTASAIADTSNKTHNNYEEASQHSVKDYTLLNEYLSAALDNPSNMWHLVRLSKIYHENGRDAFINEFEEQKRSSAYHAKFNLATNTGLLIFIAYFLPLGMVSPVCAKIVSGFLANWVGLGYAGLFSYIVQSFTLAPLVLSSIYSILPHLIMLPFLAITGLFSEEYAERLQHYWTSIKAHMPPTIATKITALFSIGLAAAGAYSYVVAYAGLAKPLTLITNRATLGWPAYSRALQWIYQNTPGVKTTVISGQMIIAGIMFLPAKIVWERFFHFMMHSCCSNSQDPADAEYYDADDDEYFDAVPPPLNSKETEVTTLHETSNL